MRAGPCLAPATRLPVDKRSGEGTECMAPVLGGLLAHHGQGAHPPVFLARPQQLTVLHQDPGGDIRMLPCDHGVQVDTSTQQLQSLRVAVDRRERQVLGLHGQGRVDPRDRCGALSLLLGSPLGVVAATLLGAVMPRCQPETREQAYQADQRSSGSR